ncbi:hypothetical protein [Streptomyces sp. NPDC004546]|uniref:hypothetical protein n=1 Tax=Streptomyces sp. NPDC004546 TaxID=3154282 RepID=UPI0033A56BC3
MTTTTGHTDVQAPDGTAESLDTAPVRNVDDFLADLDDVLAEQTAPAVPASEPAPAEAQVPAPTEPPQAAPTASDKDWWDPLYRDDRADQDTFTGNLPDSAPPRPPHPPAVPAQVEAEDGHAADPEGDDPDDEETDGADETPAPASKKKRRAGSAVLAKVKSAKGGQTAEETGDDGPADDQVDPDDEDAVTRVWRQAKALKALAKVEGRRRAALLYLPGTALAWGLDWHRRVIAYMDAGYVAPDGLIGSLIGLTALGGGLWLAARKKSQLLAVTSLVVAGVGYAEGGPRTVAYMTAHGFDPAIVTPVGSAILAGALTWWCIDRRTAHWFPPLACVMRTPTAAIGLALIFYAAPTL